MSGGSGFLSLRRGGLLGSWGAAADRLSLIVRVNMNWLNSFKKNESALSKLSKIIFDDSLSCAESLRSDLEEKYGKDSKEFQSKYVPVVFEFMYFFLHLTNRSAFSQLGHEKRNRLQSLLAPLVIEPTIDAFFGHWPKNLKDGIKNDFYSNLNNAEMGYGSCKELLLKPEEDTPTREKIESGKLSKSMVGQLIDNLLQIIEGKINTNPFFIVVIWEVVVDTLKKKEIDRLVLAVSKEMK